MGLKELAYNKLKNVCTSLGNHNDALYAVLAIAVFKGVMRPTFTMMDKKSDRETKKYAAFREGLTEVIAFCSYIATHKLILPLAVPLAKKTKASPKKVKNGLSLLSVCLSAGVIIPAICNASLKPIMDGVKKLSKNKNNTQLDEKTAKTLDIKEKAVEEKATVPSLLTPNPSGNLLQIMQKNYIAQNTNSSMRVGL